MIKVGQFPVYASILILGCGTRPPIPTTTAVSPSVHDLGAEVTSIFRAKCSSCHGSNLDHPEGRFGYVLDLPRIRNDPEFVIPGSPSESELWIVVQRGEMPPADSLTGPLSELEQIAIRDWIAAGAPDAQTPSEAGRLAE